MIVEKVHNGIRYTLSNENLNVNDEVFPIAWGRCVDNNQWILHEIDYDHSGFPDEPHIITNLNYSDYKPYQVSTDFGYGPIEQYFKIIKKEKKETKTSFGFAKWVEI